MDTMSEGGEALPTPGAQPETKPSVAFKRRVGWAFVLGGVGALSFPPHPFPLLLPIVLTGLFVLLQDMTPRQAAYIGQAFGTTLAACALRWLWDMFGPAALSLWAIIGAFTAVTCALTVWLRARLLPHVPFPLLLAVVWTGIEYFRSEPMALNFGWLGVGYPLIDSPLPARIAGILGSYGISFLVVAGCAYAAMGQRPRLIALRLIPLLLLLLPFPRPLAAPDPAQAFHVRLVQANSEDDETLFRLSQSPANPNPQLLVWPELSFYSDPRPNDKLWKPGKDPHEKGWQKLRALALDHHFYFLFGAKDESRATTESDFRNTAFLLDPQADLVGKHVKNHTVHFTKDGVAGTDAHVFPTPFGSFGVGICFDLDYPDVARRLVNNGAESLIVPSNNPLNWGPVQHAQHKQVFQMRAAECDRWLATADIAGNTFLVAPTGQIVRSVPNADPTTLDISVGRLQTHNLFVRGGWRFGQLCLLFLSIGVAWAALRRASV
ncbi:MAG: lnt [Chthonomonadales bacterium]|nr:lnt [Chthonomonadales bacterium]